MFSQLSMQIYERLLVVPAVEETSVYKGLVPDTILCAFAQVEEIFQRIEDLFEAGHTLIR